MGMSCELWYGGDPCSQVALQRVRGNPELARVTRLLDVRNRRCSPPSGVTLVPTLLVSEDGMHTRKITGRAIHAFASGLNAREVIGSRALLTTTDLRFALGADKLESRAELQADIA